MGSLDPGRRSLTCPNEVVVEIDNDEPRPRKNSSVGEASERGELMSSSFFDEEEAVGNTFEGERKWEDFI